MIVRDLVEGPKHFSELERAGINPRTLSARLRRLVREGFVRREPVGYPRAPYRLSPKGEGLLPLISFLRSYGETWLPLPQSREAGDQAAAGAAPRRAASSSTRSR